MAVAHKPGLPEQSQMFRHGGLRDACLGGQRADRQFSLAAQALENGTPGRVGEGAEKGVGRGHQIDN
jgi:hypothetical protein